MPFDKSRDMTVQDLFLLSKQFGILLHAFVNADKASLQPLKKLRTPFIPSLLALTPCVRLDIFELVVHNSTYFWNS